MDHGTQQQPPTAGHFKPCGQCTRGWDTVRHRACDCFRAFLDATTRAMGIR